MCTDNECDCVSFRAAHCLLSVNAESKIKYCIVLLYTRGKRKRKTHVLCYN